MEDIVKALMDANEMQQKAQKEIQGRLKEALPLSLEWPPIGLELLTKDKIDAGVHGVELAFNSWYFAEPIPEDAMIEPIKGLPSVVKLSYAREHGMPLGRVMTQKYSADINILLSEDDAAKIMKGLEEMQNSLVAELNKEGGIIDKTGKKRCVTGIELYVKQEDYVIGFFITCLVASEPTDEFIHAIRKSDMQKRMQQLMSSMEETCKALPKNKDKSAHVFEWELTPSDAELACDVLREAKQAVTTPEALIGDTIAGYTVKSVTADDTKLNLVLDKGIPIPDVDIKPAKD